MLQSFTRDGFAFPLRALTPERAAQYRDELEATEALHADDATATKLLKGAANIVLPFAAEIMLEPTVLQPVRELLGDDLMVIGANLFIKEPHSPGFISWHQDLTYWGYENADEVTAWVALSPATEQSGCMRFVPGSHRSLVEHRDTFSETNMLSRGQEIAVDVDENDAVHVVLEPGEMSLHHGHMFHASGPNESDDRRIGLAIRYVTPAMRQTSGIKTYAHHVSGDDPFGNFELLPIPTATMTAESLELAARAIAVQESIGFASAPLPGDSGGHNR